jgi:hypothetical protein
LESTAQQWNTLKSTRNEFIFAGMLGKRLESIGNQSKTSKIIGTTMKEQGLLMLGCLEKGWKAWHNKKYYENAWLINARMRGKRLEGIGNL